TSPQAEVSVDNLVRGAAGNDGALRIPDLEPGPRALKIRLAGYQTVERPLTLTLDKREIEEVIQLTSILETAEFSESFKAEIKNWTPASPRPGWSLEPGPPPGLRVIGDAPALVNNTSIPNQPFNQYGDFTLVLTVKFVNGKGASWIVRAQDEKNYYLF